MSLIDAPSLREILTRQDNDYLPARTAFEETTGLGWHAPTPADVGGASVSVVIPARNMAYCLPRVLDALHRQETRADVEVIVVDDASSDDTALLARSHPLCPTVVRLPDGQGAAAARNVGTALASGTLILYLDGDMVLPAHALADVAARAETGLVLAGFRHNIRFTPDRDGHATIPTKPADLNADHRVRWTPPVGQRLPYSGITLHTPVNGRPLDATNEFRTLGHGARYYDWDLPRMVVTAAVAVPRTAMLDVGGLHPRFGQVGWGCDDTYLGAALIGAGLRVAPLRQLVGYHVDPPDADAVWTVKLASWPRTLALYNKLLDQAAPRGRAEEFLRVTTGQLDRCEVTP